MEENQGVTSTGEQIAFALRQAKVGTPVAEVFRKMGITSADEGPDLSFCPIQNRDRVNLKIEVARRFAT